MSKILIIEDDKAIARLLTLALKTKRYESLTANNGLTGISLFLSNRPDLVLLDMGLPDIDGMEVLKQIRQTDNTPIIIVSARDKEQEKVEALDNGADDYVTKPFNAEELLARIRVAFRKHTPKELNSIFSLNAMVVDFNKRKVYIEDKEVHLTPIEFNLLKLLIEHKGKVLTHSFIQNNIWGYESIDDYQTQRVFMTTLRRKIEKDFNKSYILTEIGIGYRFID